MSSVLAHMVPEVTFSKDAGRSYMVMERPADEKHLYEENMLANLESGPLLRFFSQVMDGRKYYYYDVTDKVPLSRFLSGGGVTCEQVRALIGSLIRLSSSLSEYLLDEDTVVITADMVYTDPDLSGFYFTCVPGFDYDLALCLPDFGGELLGGISHQQQDAIMLAFDFFKLVKSEGYSIRGLEMLLKKSGRAVGDQSGRDEPEPESDFGMPLRPLSPGTGRIDQAEKPKMGGRSVRSMVPGREGRSTQEMEPEKDRHLVTLILIGLVMVMGTVGIGALFYTGYMENLLISVNLNIQPRIVTVILEGVWLGLTALLIKVRIGGSRLEEDRQVAGPEASPLSDPDPDRSVNRRISSGNSFNSLSEMGSSSEATVVLNRAEFSLMLESLLPQLAEDQMIFSFPCILGSKPGEGGVVIPLPGVSRRHARIDCTGAAFMVQDLGSTNGTKINDTPAMKEEWYPLDDGDILSLGDVAYTVKKIPL